MPKDYRKLSELTLNDKNPRGIKKDDFERLKKQIQKLGQYKPVLITKQGKVLGGNMRLRAYKDLGMDTVWVSVVEPKNETEEMEYVLSDNDSAGYWEEQDLAELISQLPELDLKEYKIDIGKFKSLDDLLREYKPDEIIEDEVPELQDEAVSKLGEVYQLGRHRLMCGDSTKIEDVEKLMNGQKADMVFTDPPYGVGYEQGKFTGAKVNKVFEAIANDDKTGKELYDFIYQVMSNVNAVSSEVCSVYVCSPPMTESLAMLYACINSGFHMQSQLIWYKNQFILGRADYHWQHEIIWYGYKGSPHFWSGDRSLSTVWEIHKDSHSSYEHPTQKPVELPARAIKNSSMQDNIVLDLFGGSGSTLIACEQLNRTCYMAEIDPKYCDVIRKRYAKFIGEEDWQKVTPLADQQ